MNAFDFHQRKQHLTHSDVVLCSQIIKKFLLKRSFEVKLIPVSDDVISLSFDCKKTIKPPANAR